MQSRLHWSMVIWSVMCIVLVVVLYCRNFYSVKYYISQQSFVMFTKHRRDVISSGRSQH